MEKRVGWNEVVTLTFGDIVDETLRCQKYLLIDKSDYFKAMFSSGMVETKSNTVEIKDMDINVMKKLIDYMSTGVSSLTNKTVYCITAAACRFQVTDLVETCCEYLEKNLSHTSCFNTFELSHLYDLKVFEKAKRHIQHYFTQISRMEEFLSLEVTTLEWLLQQKVLNVESEMEVYYALERWLDSDIKNRLQYSKELSQYIHFEDLLNQFDELPKLKYLNLSKDDISERMKNGMKLRGRKYRQVPEVMLCVGVQFFEEETNTNTFDSRIYKFNIKEKCFNIDYTNCLTDLRMVLPNVEGHGGISICVNGKDIIVSGGEPVLGKNTWNLGVYCFDTFNEQWRQLTDLQSPRRHHASCAIDKCLYLLGGFGRYRVRLNSMEKYDCDEEKWTTLAPSPMHGYHKAVTVLDNNIYALFGNDMVLCYCPVQDSWTNLQLPSCIMNDTKSFLGAHTYNSKIYARGDNNKIYILKVDDIKSLEVVRILDQFTNVNNNTHGIQICNDIMYCIHKQNQSELLYIDLIDSTLVDKATNVMSNPNRDLVLSSECKLDLIVIPVYNPD